MKRISYVGGSFVTSDEVAAALLDFIAAGARSRRNQVVTVPEFIGEEHSSAVSLLLGPSSQLLSQDEPWSHAEPDTSEAVQRVRAQANVHEETARLTMLHADATFDGDFD
ncbi:hypothetical protein [Agreia sp. COWG]|uniref:hypothetical protein n=1 Tax=Agreia sp. COWG TaxID=2773266 RepID=UPI001927FBDE|nr:hypothetical protein [Agreia sp. COWG]CAD6003888.1 conserved protein of unknown function [Agreia sp. COWG]